VSVGLRHNTGMLGLPDYRGLSMVAFFATCNIVITLLWSAVDHWTLSDPHGGGFYLIVASLGMPLLLPRYRADGKIAAALGTMLAMLIFTRSAAVLCYMITSTGAPLVDATLVRWDDALGFDWVGHGRWLQHHPWLMAALSWSYGSVLPQFVVMTLYLAFTGRYKQLSDFCGVLVLTALICEVVSALVPAAGASKHFAAQLATDISPLSDFEPLRAGTLRSINVGALQGLVSIPSFHTILGAVVYRCNARHVAGAAILAAQSIDAAVDAALRRPLPGRYDRWCACLWCRGLGLAPACGAHGCNTSASVGFAWAANGVTRRSYRFELTVTAMPGE